MKLSASFRTVEGWKFADLRMYVTHLGFVGDGQNMSKSRSRGFLIGIEPRFLQE